MGTPTPINLEADQIPIHLDADLIANVIDPDCNTHVGTNLSPDHCGPDQSAHDQCAHIEPDHTDPDTPAHVGPDCGAHHTGAHRRCLSAQAYAVAFDFVAEISTAARIAAGNEPRYAAWPSKSRARS